VPPDPLTEVDLPDPSTEEDLLIEDHPSGDHLLEDVTPVTDDHPSTGANLASDGIHSAVVLKENRLVRESLSVRDHKADGAGILVINANRGPTGRHAMVSKHFHQLR